MGVVAKYSDEHWMQVAVHAAQTAADNNEVPVGAVLVKNNEAIAIANNSPIARTDPTAHAEIIALREAAKIINNYRLIDTELFVTLEPCMMCAGAMLHARIKRLVFGASDPKTGVAGGCFDWLVHDKHTHKIAVTGGVMQEQCSALLTNFFKAKRAQQ